MMFWYDLTPEVLTEFTQASHRTPAAQPSRQGPELAYYVAPSEECRVAVYPLYMWRRWWGRALATAQEAGFRVREVLTPAEAAGGKALLVLAADLTPTETATVRAMGLPLVLPEGAEAAKKQLIGATTLPSGAAAQVAAWKQWLPPGQ